MNHLGRGGKRSTQGFTLIELVVAGLIGTILTAGITVAMVNYLRSGMTNIGISEVQSQLRSALDYIAQDLREARYIYRPPGTTCPVQSAGVPYNTCPVDITVTKYDLPEGAKGGQVDVVPLVGNDFAGVARDARVQLAMWIPAVKGAQGTGGCNVNNPDYDALSDGDLLSTANNFAQGPPSLTNDANDADSDGKVNEDAIWDCQPYGANATKLAYILVVYLTQNPTENNIGPRILSRWTSAPVGIDVQDFGKGRIDTTDPTLSTPAGYVLATPTPTSSNQRKGEAEFLTSYLADEPNGAGARALVYNSIDPLNGRTFDVQIRGSFDGVDDADNDPIGKGRLDTTESDISRGTIGDDRHLMYRTTVVARNVCGGAAGDLLSCPPDPNTTPQ